MLGVHPEERGFTFARIERKTPILKSALQSNQSFLFGVYRSRDLGGGRPNGQVVSIKRATDQRRQRSRKIIDEK